MTKSNCCPKPKDIAILQNLEKVYVNLTNGTYSVIEGGKYGTAGGKKVQAGHTNSLLRK